MNNIELSNEFDTIMNSYSLTEQFGLIQFPISLEFDEYEKSIFLTKAQEEFVLNSYNSQGQYPYESTEYFRRLFSDLNSEVSLKYIDKSTILHTNYKFKLPEDLLFITLETVIYKDNPKCPNSLSAQVIPVRQDELHKTLSNPFKGVNMNRVLRSDIGDKSIIIYSKLDIDKYIIRYIRLPNPIILEDFDESLSINGSHEVSQCELNPIFHRTILEIACKEAYNVRLKTAKLAAQTGKEN